MWCGQTPEAVRAAGGRQLALVEGGRGRGGGHHHGATPHQDAELPKTIIFNHAYKHTACLT